MAVEKLGAAYLLTVWACSVTQSSVVMYMIAAEAYGGQGPACSRGHIAIPC
jgi:hypothetical protein